MCDHILRNFDLIVFFFLTLLTFFFFSSVAIFWYLENTQNLTPNNPILIINMFELDSFAKYTNINKSISSH